MYYYFSSEFPSAIKLNGIYLGYITDTVKCIDVDAKGAFIEICPTSQNCNAINFTLDDSFVQNPPTNVTVTDMKGGYLIKFLRPNYDPNFKVICQQKFSDLVATLFNENGLKLSLETPTDFFADNFCLQVKNGELIKTDVLGAPILCLRLLGEKQYLACYLYKEKIKKIFFDQIESFDFENGFSTTKKFVDIQKHTVTTEWQLKNDLLIVKSKTVQNAPSFNIEKLNAKLLPFAMLEELLVGGNVLPYLNEGMQQNAQKLKGYLGNFIGVMPPPLFRSIDELGLVYPNGDRKYIVKYFTFELDDRKICNIKAVED